MSNAPGKPLPLYQRVKQHLLERIARGEWQNGARLPSEHELMASLGASRMTVHRALREMSADGVLRRAQGIGTFIQRRPPHAALLEITDIADDIAKRGHTHHARIITLQAIKADAPRAADFALRRGAKLFHSVILHDENGIPVQLEERFVTPLFAPHYLQQDFAAQTTGAYLQSIAPPSEVEHIIHAIMPDVRTQSLLNIGPQNACLRLNRRTWTAAGPATISILTHAPGYSLGSRYAFPRPSPQS
jgi:GntR family histidine utilization transcriptional repressor